MSLATQYPWLRRFGQLFVLGTSLGSVLALSWYLNYRWGESVFAHAAVLFLCLNILVLSGLLVWQEYRYSRKARSAEAMASFDGMLRAVNAELSDDDPRELIRVMSLVVQETAEAFSVITGTRVSASLKLVSTNPEYSLGKGLRPFAVDVCRDMKSVYRMERTRERERQAGRPVHFIDQNSDFSRLVNCAASTEDDYAIHYDLSRQPDYQTSSYEVYGRPTPTHTTSSTTRSLLWPLPYKSVLLVRLAIPNGSEVAGWRVIGFLSVDSRSRRAFNSRQDLSYLRAVGELIKPVLDRYMISSNIERYLVPSAVSR